MKDVTLGRGDNLGDARQAAKGGCVENPIPIALSIIPLIFRPVNGMAAMG
jgi:hypothetical protein